MNTLNVQEIIEKHNIIDLMMKKDKDGIMSIIEKYPEQKHELMVEMLKSGTKVLRRQTIINREKTIKELTIFIELVDKISEVTLSTRKCPMINDFSVYENVSDEENEEMVKEDMAIGVKLYNTCAKFCRVYNEFAPDDKHDKP